MSDGCFLDARCESTATQFEFDLIVIFDLDGNVKGRSNPLFNQAGNRYLLRRVPKYFEPTAAARQNCIREGVSVKLPPKEATVVHSADAGAGAGTGAGAGAGAGQGVSVAVFQNYPKSALKADNGFDSHDRRGHIVTFRTDSEAELPIVFDNPKNVPKETSQATGEERKDLQQFQSSDSVVKDSSLSSPPVTPVETTPQHIFSGLSLWSPLTRGWRGWGPENRGTSSVARLRSIFKEGFATPATTVASALTARYAGDENTPSYWNTDAESFEEETAECVHFNVHRWIPPVIYGRRHDNNSEGFIALQAFIAEDTIAEMSGNFGSATTVFFLVTFRKPHVVPAVFVYLKFWVTDVLRLKIADFMALQTVTEGALAPSLDPSTCNKLFATIQRETSLAKRCDSVRLENQGSYSSQLEEHQSSPFLN